MLHRRISMALIGPSPTTFTPHPPPLPHQEHQTRTSRWHLSRLFLYHQYFALHWLIPPNSQTSHKKKYFLWHFFPSILFLVSHKVVSNSFVTPETVVLQGPPFVGFPREEFWSGLLLPSPRDLPDPGMESASLALAGGFFTTEPPGKSSQLFTTLFFQWKSFQ